LFALVALIGTLIIAGCGGDPALSDRFVENKGADAFLDKVRENCGSLYIGNQQVRDLIKVNPNDAYFVDETSKLYFGKAGKAGYTSDINAFFPMGDNKAALDCIFQQLEE
jgi:hypothetical protein